jgi:NADPH:quinone reductase-like Zn-dependent oxidoreductase
MTATMTALGRDEYGPHLTQRTVPVPAVTEGRVLVRVEAAGIARGTWHLMHGLPRAVRFAGFGMRRPKQPIIGTEATGVIEAVGPGVTDLHVGDRVFGAVDGAFAEFALARPRNLAPAPTSVDAVHAAVLPDSGLTALQALDRTRVADGDRVLVIGASGGVGSYAVQLAHARGAVVTGVCSGAKADFVRSLGATHVIDYERAAITDGGVRYDVILDIAGNRPVRELRRALTPRGRLMIVGGEGGGSWFGGLHRQLGAVLLSPFVRQRLGTFVATIRTADLRRLAVLVDDGAVRPALDRVCTLDAVAAALGDMEAGRLRGKVAVRISAGSAGGE